MQVEFSGPEYQVDGSFETAAYRFEGSPGAGWTVMRRGKPHLELGPGYRLLKALSCGICSTDLARRFLPFPLPQIIGHEVLALDEEGRRCVVEINASHHARGVDADCPFCRHGLHTHCPDRIVLGIHDLPGGFGPHFLAPVDAIIPVHDGIPSRSAVLVEPLAAAIHAITSIQPREGERIAVLGPRRLGLLVVAALRAYRAAKGIDFEITALARRQELLALSRTFGADAAVEVEGQGEGLPGGMADVVIDTTGSPEGLELAIRLARREVHLKSTHGRPAAGLDHLTELVVDEIGLYPFASVDCSGKTVAWLASGGPPPDFAPGALLRGNAEELLTGLEANPPDGGLPRADLAVVDRAHQIDAALRPDSGREVSLVRPRGAILLLPGKESERSSPLVEAVRERGIKLTSSRCGDFHAAIGLMAGDPALSRVGDTLVTHRFPVSCIAEAFHTAGSAECIKAVVEHEGAA